MDLLANHQKRFKIGRIDTIFKIDFCVFKIPKFAICTIRSLTLHVYMKFLADRQNDTNDIYRFGLVIDVKLRI